jgi:hypothetical protein
MVNAMENSLKNIFAVSTRNRAVTLGMLGVYRSATHHGARVNIAALTELRQPQNTMFGPLRHVHRGRHSRR